METDTGIEHVIPTRFAQVDLPSVHLENIYVRVGDHLDRHLGAELIPWTHSDQFHKNGTVRPVIMALFAPFSAMDWLTFNSSTLGLSGDAPFAAVSYNVSITLVPAFVDKTEEITVPLNNTPMTFTTASFSVFVLSEEPASTDLKAWTPYLVIALIIIAVMSFAFALATCCWQDMCPSRVSCSSRSDRALEEAKDSSTENRPARNRSLRHLRNIDSTWSVFGKAGHRQDFTQVTPYDILVPTSPVMRYTNPHTVQERCFREEDAPAIPDIIGGIQYTNIVAGSSFAVKLRICRSMPRFPGTPVRFQARATPFAPEWMHFCAESMIVWGTVPGEIVATRSLGFDVFVMSDAHTYALAKLSINILAQARTVDSEPPYTRAFSGGGEGVWFGTSNGIDILNVLSGTTFCVKYHPKVLQSQPLRQGRYCFSSVQALPGWLTLNSLTLELVGNTTGYRRRDLRDIVVLDQETGREVAKLRIVLVIADDKLG